MHNDELDEKKLVDFMQNTTVRIEMTVEQASNIYASLMYCARRFRQFGNPDRAEYLERLARNLMGE